MRTQMIIKNRGVPGHNHAKVDIPPFRSLRIPNKLSSSQYQSHVTGVSFFMGMYLHKLVIPRPILELITIEPQNPPPTYPLARLAERGGVPIDADVGVPIVGVIDIPIPMLIFIGDGSAGILNDC
jgi:hypothetical protein